MSMEDQRPKIGVGVAIHDKQGNVVMGVRSGSHGAGTYLFPLLYTTPKIENSSCKAVYVLYFCWCWLVFNAGTHQFPGGHLEYGESFADCAIREVREETGLEVGDVKFLTATNDVMADEGKHYVTVFVTCVIVGENKVPQVSVGFLAEY